MVMCLYTARIPIQFMAVTNCAFFFFLVIAVFFFGGGEIRRQLLVVVRTLVDLFLGLEIVRTNKKFYFHK